MDTEEDNDNIWMACSDGNIECVKSLIKSGVSINAQDENGYSPMYEQKNIIIIQIYNYFLIINFFFTSLVMLRYHMVMLILLSIY